MNDEILSLHHFEEQIEQNGNGHRAPLAETGPLMLDPTAEPPSDKFAALMEADRKFKGAWKRTRTDMADTTPSGWDMALANAAIAAGWTDQEVANLLIASRRQHGDELKLRQDYYGPTIANARVKHGNYEQIVEKAGPEPENRKAAALQYVSQHFGVAVHGMIRHPGPPASYRLKTELGEMPIKSIDALTSATKFRNVFADSTGKVLPLMKPKLWETIAQALLDVCEDDVIEDSTEEGRAKDWLEGYLAKSRIYQSADAGAPMRKPFVSAPHDSRTAFFGDGLHYWLLKNRMEKVSKAEMSALLRAVGCDQVKVNVDIDGKRTSRLVWLRPHPIESENYST